MTPPEIDQLIEEGLTLYGQGDLDAALMAWEKALAADPENAQASSYVDYVRSNYDLLTGEISNDESKVPFGLDDEPYQIEILPGELDPEPVNIGPPPIVAGVDEGWFMDDDSAPQRSASAGESEQPAQPVSFEDETREYESGRSFASTPTNLKERDTGFVRPTRNKLGSQVPPEIEMTLRSPGEQHGGPSYDEPPTAERTLTPEAAELINSLPTPTPVLRAVATTPIDPASGLPRTHTADLPNKVRPPAITEGLGTFTMPTLTRDPTTRDFESQPTNAALPKPSATPTRELAPGEVTFNRELVSAPTRDLGLRPAGLGGISITTNPIAEDDKTISRKPIGARAPSGLGPAGVGEGTRADVILPFDPIDARSAQILDDVDEGAPEQETKEDRTRRRITTLFEQALAYAQGGELDKAVAAIDLALSEDPNSALGQKLVHRHREQMLSVYQSFLGDLDRQPALARPLHELANAPISPRAAFLLSRIDGTLTMDELLDVSGMPRIEAYRYLCQLFLRGILR